MMTENHDPVLQSLFAEAEQELDGTAIAARVMAGTRRLKLFMVAGAVAAAGVLLAGAWLIFGMPLFDFAVYLSDVLATPLVNLGEGWLGLLLLPVNTVAGVLVLMVKALRMFRNRIAGASSAG